ncbi:bestrophin family protein [Azonexus sp. IMCC34839]|uniref:bestrophin family protein n=1 Tax=Azonexus sp. IMCC34839 TaxID=3133695 RepID=UPI00399AD68C
MIVRPRHHWFRLLFVWRGSVLPQIIGRLALILAVSVASLLCSDWWLQHFPDSALSIPPFTLMGIALAIFLGFRNSVSYDRFWEARKQWGMLLVVARALVNKLLSVLPDENHRALREQVTRSVAAFAYALKHQVRGTDAAVDMAKRLKTETLAAIDDKQFPAQVVLREIGKQLVAERRAGQIADMEWLAMDRSLEQLGEVAGACERIANTPIPYTYRVLMNRTIVIYCLLLPIGLTTTLGWLTPLIATFVAYTFLALEMVGEQLEEPFGTEANDLALDAMCHTIECATCELAGLEVLGDAPVVRDYVLT